MARGRQHTRVADLTMMMPRPEFPKGTIGIFFLLAEIGSFLQQRDNGGGKTLSFHGIVMLLTFFFKVLIAKAVLRFIAGLRLEKGNALSPGAPVTISIFKLQQNDLFKTGVSKRDRPFTLLAKMRLERPINK